MSSIGIKLPLTYNSADGFTMIKSIRQMVRQNLKMLILTNPGERVMDPTFGVGITRYLFGNYNSGVQSRIRSSVEEQVAMYMPAIGIEAINFRDNPDSHTLHVVIKYSVPNIGISDLLQITI
tara:strand:+ start:363 stop:728 length:366 start_codon:yes stop_codon:yes gene_type:complete